MSVTITGKMTATGETTISSAMSVMPIAGDTALFSGGREGVGFTTITTLNFINISSSSNAVTFGDLLIERYEHSSTSNGTNGRGVFSGGVTDNGSLLIDSIEYLTINVPGDGQVFGELSATEYRGEAVSNGTTNRGVFALGAIGAGSIFSNIIDYITISTTGSATDYADMRQESIDFAGTSNGSNDRAIFADGSEPLLAYPLGIDYKTISTGATTVLFGFLLEERTSDPAAVSNTTDERGVFTGGSSFRNLIDFITISTTGNAGLFGYLNDGGKRRHGAASNGTNDGAVFAGGVNGVSASTDSIDHITITSTGNATDFGDLDTVMWSMEGMADA